MKIREDTAYLIVSLSIIFCLGVLACGALLNVTKIANAATELTLEWGNHEHRGVISYVLQVRDSEGNDISYDVGDKHRKTIGIQPETTYFYTLKGYTGSSYKLLGSG